ncbi:hypothetical protein RYX36_010924 [Vicia faba]
MENYPAPLPDQDGIEDADAIPAELRSSIRFTKRSILQEQPVRIKHLLYPELRNVEETQSFVADDNSNDGFRTPPDRIIKRIHECPGAPRKKKFIPPKRMKRKSPCARKLVFDSL